MATHSSVLAWRIPGPAELDRLPSKGSHRVGHDWSNLAAAAAKKIRGLPWEKGMATHSGTLAWKSPWMEKPGWLQSIGLQRVGHDWATSLFTSLSLVAHMVKHLPATRETWVWSLGQRSLEKAMANHSSILVWKIPWTEEPGRLQSMRLQSQTRLSKFTHLRRLGHLRRLVMPGEGAGRSKRWLWRAARFCRTL